MFSFLKNKIKSGIEEVTKILEKEPKDEINEIRELELTQEKKHGVLQKIKEGISTTKIDEAKFEQIFSEFERALLENNVAYEVVEKIKNDLKNELIRTQITRFKVEETIKHTLRSSIESLFNVERINLLERIKEKKPYIIIFFGINGTGKTTTIAKVAKLLKNNGLSVVVSASDTFRVASIEQIEKHCEKIGVKVVKHNYGSDPSAVAYDSIEHAKARGLDVVLIDTAGRMHSNTNLVNEMKKIVRVAKPELKIFIGESITGNDCIEQVKIFDNAVGIDGIILTKADVDEKGGTAISIGYVTKKPILFLGTGQNYDDLKEFDRDLVLEGLGI